MKLRILQVYRIFPALFGGISTVVHSITRELCKRKHDVTIYTTDVYLNGKSINGYSWGAVQPKVYYFPSLLRTSLGSNVTVCGFKFVHSVKKMIRSFNVIHLHGYRTFQNIIVHHYAKRNNVPYVFQAHGTLPRVMPWRRLKWFYDIVFGYRLLRGASKVIALSEAEADQYRSMGVPEEKIAIIPNGIDLSKYAELPPKGAFKKKFNIAEDKKIILYLGRIHKTKGIDFLVRAYAYLKNETNVKDAILVIAGPDDRYLSKIKSLVQDLGISNSVLFTGLLSEKDKIRAYVDSDVVVNVEPLNVYGLVPLEAAACSTPVIVSKTNAISEVVAAGKFGYSVKYDNVTSLAFTLRKILDDEELAEKLGRNGRTYIFNNFDWSKIIERYEHIYREAAIS